MQLTPFLFSHRSSLRGSRRYARVVFSTPITLYHLTPGGVRSSRGVTLDISEGGLGVLVEGWWEAPESSQIGTPTSFCLASRAFRHAPPLQGSLIITTTAVDDAKVRHG